MAMLTSANPEATRAIGAAWGQSATSGLVIGLSGDLGAGKTELVKGLAEGLGTPVRVHSPTFSLLNEYRGGRVTLFHLDLYRLDKPSDVLGAGLDDFLFEPAGISVVEWIERWLGPDGTASSRRPRQYRHVRMRVLDSGVRQIEYDDFGP